MKKTHARMGCAVLICLGLSAAAMGQESRGTILGRVSDATGAVVPGATVRVTNIDTGASAAARSNESGSYTIPFLLPGAYRMAVEAAGFKASQRSGIELRINDTLELNVELTVGDVSEHVDVTESTPLLETTTASLGQVVDTRRIAEMPLQAGNPFELVLLAPGVSNGTDLRLRKAGWNGAPSQILTDGNRMYSNEFTIDGVTNTFAAGSNPRVAFSPPSTAVAEVKVQTSSFDASLGHSAGSVINTVTKGGTNTLHGELHEQLANSALDAPDFFQNRSGQSKAQYTDNRYGFSVGGPVFLPKIYNGKNKTFFFYAHERNQWGAPGTAEMTVPTLAERNGDFSKLLNVGGDYQIYDPFTARAGADGVITRQPLAGNMIPASRIDPVARNIAKYWPAPNFPGTEDDRFNYVVNNTAAESYWVHLVRIDHNFSENHRLFIRLNRDFWQEDKNNYFENVSSGIILNRINRGAALDDVIVLSPATILNLRYGLTQQEFPERRKSKGFDLSSLGFSQSVTSLVDKSLATFPNVNFDNFDGMGYWESGDGTNTSMVHTFAGNMTTLRGSHNLRYGAEFRLYRKFQARYPYDVSPSLYFDSTYTSGPTDNDAWAPTGQDMASFLFGIPGGQMNRSATSAEQDRFAAAYVQDDWKVTKKLTINVGLRYEFETPISERFDRSVRGFAFDAANPIQAVALANYAKNPAPQVPVSQFQVLGGLLFAGSNGHGLWDTNRGAFMPRIGLAYEITPKTIVRTGFGIFYDTLGVNRTASIQTGFTQVTPVIASQDDGLHFDATNANPFPNGLLAPLGAKGGLSTFLGQTISFYPTSRPQPYSQRWSFGIQRQLPGQSLLDVSYVGNRGTHLPIVQNIGALPDAYLSTSPVRDQTTINYLNQRSPNPFYGLDPVYGSNITLSNLLRPYPQFSAVNMTTPDGYSWYHAMQVRAEKRFSRGFTAQLGYTWAKNMEAMNYLNAGDPLPSEVISSLDRTHRLTGSAIYELPFGKGKALGANLPGAVNALVGNWQLDLVMQRQSGDPLGFGNALFEGNLKDVPLAKDQRSVDDWFNVDSGFVRKSSQQLASNLRTFPLRFSGIRGPGQARWDLSAIKNFPIRERLKMQFRAEAFNAWNHPNFYDPDTSPTSSTFGMIDSQMPTPRSFQFSLRMTF